MSNNKNNNNNNNNIPENITAEWTVHAQLTISTKKPQQDNDSSTATTKTTADHESTDTTSNTQSNPVTVIYKWSSGGDSQQKQQCSVDSTLDGDGDGDTSEPTSSDPTSFRNKKDNDDTANFQNQTNNKTFGFANNNESSERKTFSRASTTPTRKLLTSADGNTAGSTQTYNSRCRSTCRIVLSACTDLFPLNNKNNSSNNVNNNNNKTTTPITTIDDQPFGYNTTARCIISPDKSLHFDPPEISKTVQFLSVKDAFSQTSDTEQPNSNSINKFKSSSSTASMADSYNTLSQQRSTISNDGRRFRRPYDYRRITADSLISVMSPPSFPGSLNNSRRESPSSVSIKQLSPSKYDEGKNVSPSRQNQQHRHHHHQSRSPLFNKRYSPSNHAISTSTTSMTNPSVNTIIQQDSNKSIAKKSPRTVHIDVYCTGSEAEEDTSSDDEDDDDNDDDDDDDDDVDDDNESEDGLYFDDPHLYEEESNSTPQTVFNSKQIKLHHSRVTNKNDLPRRIINQKKKEKQSKKQEITSPRKLREYLLQNSTSKDEICESKQMLFNKHIGTTIRGAGSGVSVNATNVIGVDNDNDVNAFVNPLPVTSSATQQRKTNKNRFQYNQLNKDQSEDGLSSNYPNSSRSTVRDMTCSSISSGALASSSAIYDDLESSWKESDNALSGGPSYSNNNYHYQQIDEALTPSDSLEYEPITPPTTDNNNSPLFEQQPQQLSWLQPPLSLGEITAAQKGWRSPEKERRFLLQQKRMIEFMHHNEKQMREKPYEEENNNNKKLSPPHYYIYNNVTPKNPPLMSSSNYDDHQKQQQLQHQQQQQNQQQQQQQNSFKPTTTIPIISNQHKKVLFTPNYNEIIDSSGYNTMPIKNTEIINNNNESNSNHWSRARKFGHIIGAMRKTGRHFGPAKNPDCQCDHCRRWMVERDQQKGRGRALSMGDEPFNRSSFWLARHQL